ncbi:ATP-binding protein [Actinomycetaceae bacterium Sa1BUA1]|uniref:ATP-binding protein n=1 Tax=Oceanitalea stevensii TaxID=2763072 RepID=A0ABR8Z3P8_9MICO|nr:ATP-binding protein [Oceanitalea stevensii]
MGDGVTWEEFADVALQREAALCRLAAGVPPRDYAGLVVDDADVSRALRSLPGLDGPPAAEAERVRALFAPRWAAARAALAEWLRAGLDPLALAARNAGLGPPGAEALALACAVEVEPQRQRLVAYVQDSVRLDRPTLAVVDRILGREATLALAPGAPLRTSGLVDVRDDGSPWAVRMCTVAPRLVWATRGHHGCDPALQPGATVRHPRGATFHLPSGDSDAVLLLVHGADAESRRRAVAERHPARPLLVTPVPTSTEAWAATAREATIRGAVVLVETDSALDERTAVQVARLRHLAVAISSPRELPLESVPARRALEVAVRDGEADEQDWRERMGSEPPDGFHLSREQLRLAAGVAHGDASRLPAAVRRLAGGHLEGLATRVHAQRGWADLVLPFPQERLLRELVVRYRRRRTVFTDWGFRPIPSSGVVGLFAGPSGTGKTLAAEVAAAELGLDLYKVDLSAVVSKYIGETEKNLERIFTAAAAGDLVLFFDEADALFGKRSEVGSAHDRYANIEVAYLLQRLESFDGVAVLATNLQRNVDEAFLRRMSVVVSFAAPDEEQRRRIWQLSFPPQAPVEAVDVDFLAHQFTVTGGTIRNAALGAAFAAAEAGTAITMETVVRAMQREFLKLGHLSTEAELERYLDVLRTR